MSRVIKSAVISLPVLAAGYYFGVVCGQVSESAGMLLDPSWELLGVLGYFALALCLLAASAGLVAALVRPVWAGMIVLAISGLFIWLGWGVGLKNGALVLVYVAGAWFYAVNVAREQSERLSFSTRPLGLAQNVLFMALIFLACGSLYLGLSEHIEQEGFTIPEAYLDAIAGQLEQQIVGQLPESERPAAQAQFREQFQSTMQGMVENIMGRYRPYFALLIAAGMFFTLTSLSSLIAWIPTLVLSAIFPLLKSVRLVEEVSESRSVTRLVIR